MTKIYLLRHAQSQASANQDTSLAPDSPLSPFGQRQAQHIVPALKALSLDAVWCSPFLRAEQTISTFLSDSEIKAQVIPALAEGQLLLDATISAAASRFGPEAMPAVDERPEEFIARIDGVIKSLHSQSNKRLLLVSHDHTIRALLNRIIQPSCIVRFPHQNCGLSAVTIHPELCIEFINRPLCSD